MYLLYNSTVLDHIVNIYVCGFKCMSFCVKIKTRCNMLIQRYLTENYNLKFMHFNYNRIKRAIKIWYICTMFCNVYLLF